MNKILIKIEEQSPTKLIKLLNNLNIDIYKINYNNKEIYLKIDERNLNKIQKLYKTSIIKNYGIKKIKILSKQYKTLIYVFLIFIISTLIFSNLIGEVIIAHENKEIRTIIKEELNEYGINTFHFKKNYNYLQNVKKLILKKYKDNIEWIEFIEDGLDYIVKVQDKKYERPEIKETSCNIVATKESLISRLYAESGEVLIKENELVKPGDIIISGNITTNEEIVGQVCAKGTIYGETWYTISITIPKYRTIKELTGKERINFELNYNNKNYLIFKSRIKNPITSTKKIMTFGDYSLNLIKEKEAKTIKKEFTDREILEEIDQEIEKKLKILLKDNYTLKEKKVLKKTVNDSTIYIETFLVVEEIIGIQKTTESVEENEGYVG